MKHNSSNRRSRNRGNGSRKSNKMQVFDSNGPDVRIRGTAHQVCEKYLALAKDSAASGDSIMAENYLQHAEHYQRIINEWNKDNNRTVSTDQNQNQNEIREDKEDDLALPASILGEEVKSQPEKNVQAEPSLEEA